MFELQQEIQYFNRPAWIIGIRLPNRFETGCRYDLSRKKGSPKVDFGNVTERHLSLPTATNEVLQTVAEYRRLELVK